MLTTVHKDFEPDNELIRSPVNERIREFAIWTKDAMPENVAAVTLVIDRSGFTVHAITNNQSAPAVGEYEY